MATTACAKVGVEVKLGSGKDLTLFEGDIVRGLSYHENGELKTISGAVRVLNASTKANVTTSNKCPPEPYCHEFVTMNSLIIDSSTAFDAELTKIPFNMIEDIDFLDYDGGTIVIGPEPYYRSLTEVLTSAPSGSTIELLGGTYSTPITLNKSIKIVSESGAELTAPLTFTKATSTTETEPMRVILEGLSFKTNAKITLSNVDEFTMRDCVFGDHTFTENTMPIFITGTNKIKLTIEDNMFTATSEHAYNLIDVYSLLEDGSSISGNIFNLDSYHHNAISLYGIDTDATINIKNNHACVSQNIVRLGFKGDPHCTIILDGNSYDENDEAPYEGLAIIQPYGTETTSFAHMTVKITRTTKPAGQIIYMYNGTNDMQFTTSNKPTIFVDGVNVTSTVAVLSTPVAS